MQPNPRSEEPHAALERQFINEFLASHEARLVGFGSSRRVNEAAVMEAAMRYASLRLAEIEARAHYLDELHRSA
jgi:hypothetical protein